jgi:ZIP family zinc transporter
MSYASENVVPALLLVLGAGASTGLGAAVVFVPKLVKLASRRVLAASLGFSAGVMTYVSFIEILAKSNDSFVNAGHDENKAYIYATLCFFGGAVTMLVREHEMKTLTSHIAAYIFYFRPFRCCFLFHF